MHGLTTALTNSAPEITAAWLTFVAQMIATVVGGGLVIASNMLLERSRRRREEDERDEHHRVVLTGVFAIRNFVVEIINALTPRSTWETLRPLQAALRQMNVLVEKARPESEDLMMCLTDIQLQLDAVVTTATAGDRGRPSRHKVLEQQLNSLLGAFEMFDILSGQSLIYLDEDEVMSFGARASNGADGVGGMTSTSQAVP